ncbi:hypothetical protein GFS60_07322 (plasmid) [Rhodococcus sp. WAY2]|nr:hypothetical protein GFS60_07322 [Rhodococcus sp. WAY2]
MRWLGATQAHDRPTQERSCGGITDNPEPYPHGRVEYESGAVGLGQ